MYISYLSPYDLQYFHTHLHYSQKRVLLDEMEDELAKEDVRVGRTAAIEPDPLSQYKSVEDEPRSFEKNPIPSWVRTMLPIKNQQGGIVARYLAVDGKEQRTLGIGMRHFDSNEHDDTEKVFKKSLKMTDIYVLHVFLHHFFLIAFFYECFFFLFMNSAFSLDACIMCYAVKHNQ